MTMKQTQTKLFDFSDSGLDFCSGSRGLFPDRFKKMLSLGYNEKTVTSVAVSGDQVTLTYSVPHGYVADRVLKVDSGALASIHGGEFWIDSVTTNTLTLTIEGAPVSIASGFTTRIASLGWQLVYENGHIHIYKFKHIDDTDMYARLCFQNVMTSGNRNCIAVGIGRTVNLSTGVITDENCPADLRDCATVAAATSNLRWDFTNSTAATFNNYSYSQGFTTFGKGMVVGSIYHTVLFYNQSNSTTHSVFSGILPFQSDYERIDYPILMAQENGASTTTTGASQLQSTRLYLGNIRCTANETNYIFATNYASQSFLPSSLDGFNTTTCFPIPVHTYAERQFLGYVEGGAYIAAYAATNIPSISVSDSPSLTTDIEYNSICALHRSQQNTAHAWLVAPVEQIKHA